LSLQQRDALYNWPLIACLFAIVLNVSHLRLIGTRRLAQTKTPLYILGIVQMMNLNHFKATKSDPPCKMQTSFTEGGERHKSFMACWW